MCGRVIIGSCHPCTEECDTVIVKISVKWVIWVKKSKAVITPDFTHSIFRLIRFLKVVTMLGFILHFVSPQTSPQASTLTVCSGTHNQILSGIPRNVCRL